MEDIQQFFDMMVLQRDLLSVQMRIFMEELLTFFDNYDQAGSIASISSLQKLMKVLPLVLTVLQTSG